MRVTPDQLDRAYSFFRTTAINKLIEFELYRRVRQ